MYKNNRGAALLQVLMLSALLAGLAVMVLRVSLSRLFPPKTPYYLQDTSP